MPKQSIWKCCLNFGFANSLQKCPTNTFYLYISSITKFCQIQHTTNEWKREEKGKNTPSALINWYLGENGFLHAANSHVQWFNKAHLYRLPNEMLFALYHTLWCLWFRFYELNSYSLNLRFFGITENWLHVLRFRLTFIQPIVFCGLA